MAKPNLIKCPACGKPTAPTARVCVHCKNHIYIQQETPTEVQQVSGQTTYTGMQYTNNSNLIQCPACGNMMSKAADACPACGNPRQRKVANSALLDVIAIFAIVISIFCFMAGNIVFPYLTLLVLLIIYYCYYNSIKDNPEIDASKVKQSLNVITILFILMFGIGFVIIL